MMKTKSLVLLMVALIAALFLVNAPSSAQDIYTYTGHLGTFNNGMSDNLIAHVMFFESGIVIEQGGLTKSFHFDHMSNGFYSFISDQYDYDLCMCSFASDGSFFSMMVGQVLYSFRRM